MQEYSDVKKFMMTLTLL